MPDPAHATKHPARRVAQWLIAIGFFVLIAYFFRKYSADLSAIRRLSVTDIVHIGLWLFVSYTAFAWSQYIIMRELGLRSLGMLRWLQIYYVSRAMNFVVIQGANLYRILVLKRQYGFSLANSIGVTGYIMWLNGLSVLCVGVLTLPFVVPATVETGLLSAALVLGTILLPVLLTLAMRGTVERPAWQRRSLEPLAKVVRFFNESYRKPLLNLQVFALGVVNLLFFAAAVYVGFEALQASVSIAETLLFSAVFVLTRYVNIVPGNIGLSELVGGLAAEMLGTGFGSGLLVAGVIRIVEILLIGTLGVANGGVVAYRSLAAQREV